MRESMPLIFGWKVDFAKHPTVYDPILNLRSDFGAGPKIWSLLLRANFDSDIHVVPRNIFWLSRVDVGPWV